MVNFFMRKKDAEENVLQAVCQLLRELPADVVRAAVRTYCRALLRSGRILVHQYPGGALPVRCEQVQSDLESVQTLTRVKACHIFFRQKTGYPVGIEFGFCNIGVDRTVKMLKNNDIILVFAHFMDSEQGWRCSSI